MGQSEHPVSGNMPTGYREVLDDSAKLSTKRENLRGDWVAQSVECQSLDLCSGHDLTVCGIRPCVGSGSLLSAQSLLRILSFSTSPQLMLALSK